ncbi:LysR family transcriptional regulator [Azospirillum sp.]|uniref:LysR family transcriptional regulator n=1 Tax=Azospirillum sp. TaxID=34012 RepID=UPI002D450EB6|nr:LysR family transcriptional regulator [Azospirillum sp.]HYD68991.1 LysR family transcriptional regulator [Azospirillum sp.]
MDLRQMQYFVSLYEEGNVTRAARRLNVVQPALSMQIAKLEAELGQRLFERSRQGMAPTAAGRVLFRHLMPILRDISAARQAMAKLGGEISGQIAIGLITSVTQSVLARTLATFTARHPSVEVNVAEGYTATFMDWVASGQLDFAIINQPRKRVGLVAEPILDEEMVLVTSAATELPVPAPVTLRDAARLKLVVPSKRHGLRQLLDQHAEAEGIDLSPKFEVDALVPLSEMVAATDWVTILPAIAVHRGLNDGRLRAYPIVEPRMVRTLAWVHHPRRPLSPAASKFIEIMTENLVRAEAEVSAKVSRRGGAAPAARPSRGMNGGR